VEKVTENFDFIRVGISSCLLGEKVRFDAGHKHDRYVTDVLGPYFKFVPVCPEVEVGMGVPRESVRLIGTPENQRLVGNKTREDWTERVIKFRKTRLEQLEKYNLSGYILKKDSPSCGMERVKVYGDKGMAERKGRGMWGGALLDYFPLLPVEEEGRLNDFKLRENFIVRVFAYYSLQRVFNYGSFKRGDVVYFHTRQKLLLMAHSPKHYNILGKLVADMAKHKPSEFKEQYCRYFMEGLKFMATTKKNINVMHHIMGYLKKNLAIEEKADVLATIEDYRSDLIPLIVPLTLIRHYIKKFSIDYVNNQSYLNPHPKELMLRNHV